MPRSELKSKRSAQQSDDEWQDDNQSAAVRDESDEDYDDDGFDSDTPAPKSKRKRVGNSVSTRLTNTRTKSTKRARKDNDANNDDTAQLGSGDQTCTRKHVIGDTTGFRRDLLAWYATVHQDRGMPWRKPFNLSWTRAERAQRAYEVWVSEIMLQQTQVATVTPYYNRWMSTFPTLSHLASSNIEQVNSLWKGLGYYSRASRLLQGAQKAQKSYDGCLPDNAHDMQKNIPGIGRYSAGAICSIAYAERVPVLDGNVHRLLSRVLALHAPPKSKQTLDILWSSASSVLPTIDIKKGGENPGDVNQALIELGSTVCKVSQPDCERCPVRGYCAAYQIKSGDVPDIEELVSCALCVPLPSTGNNKVTVYPMKATKKKPREEIDLVSVVEWIDPDKPSDSWFLLTKRPEKGLLAGLYEFPSVTLPATSSTSSGTDDDDNDEGDDGGGGGPTKTKNERDSRSRSEKRLQSLLSSSSSPPPMDIQAACKPDSEAQWTVRKNKRAGDVLHIFSHIRKTYRVRWIVLDSPRIPAIAQVETSVKKSKKNKGGADGKSLLLSKWVKFEDVENANIGTGMVKVWNLVQTCRQLE